MSKKTIIIFITVFLLSGVVLFGIYYFLNKKTPTTTTDNTPAPWYQNFNPFGTSKNPTAGGTNSNGTVKNPNSENPKVSSNSKFFQITDFAIAGATFLEDTRPIAGTGDPNVPQTEQIKVIIKADTEEGRKEIQTILNNTLSLKPPLVVDGKFGKSVIAAIKSFQKLNNLPVTGVIDTKTASLFTKTTDRLRSLTEQAPSVRYVGRMNGHIYKMFLDTKAKEKISNSTIPAIYEAYFNNKADTVVYRYLSSGIINTFMATLGTTSGEFLPTDVSDMSVSPDKTKYFYLTKNSNGVTGIVGTFGESKKEIVFNYPLTEWLSSWDGNQRVFLTTKPSSDINGSVFLLDTTNKTISKLFGGVPGLTTMVNPKGTSILYGTSEGTGLELGVFDIAKHSTKDLGYGLPEKCVWSSDGIDIYCAVPNVVIGKQYPDSWYQGLISFDDSFVKINTITGNKIILANSVNETPMDGTYLFLNDTEDILFFTNKKDSTFWGLTLK